MQLRNVSETFGLYNKNKETDNFVVNLIIKLKHYEN